MTDREPRDYDRLFVAPENGPVRRRIGLDIDRGEVTRFLVQLEYLIDPLGDEWATVVRYDHDVAGAGEASHDVTDEGYISMYIVMARKSIRTS